MNEKLAKEIAEILKNAQGVYSAKTLGQLTMPDSAGIMCRWTLTMVDRNTYVITRADI